MLNKTIKEAYFPEFTLFTAPSLGSGSSIQTYKNMATECSLYITITIIHNGYCHLAHPHPQKKTTRQLQTALYTDQDKY